MESFDTVYISWSALADSSESTKEQSGEVTSFSILYRAHTINIDS